jgi:NifU-like protein involved in Fe-S cluster formation
MRAAEPVGRLADHFFNPRNVGELMGADVVESVAGRREIGTRIRLFLEIHKDIIVSARFRAYGCPVAIAVSSLLCEWLNGLSVDEAGLFDPHAAARELEVPVEKLGVILVAEDALRGCLEKYSGRAQTSEQAMGNLTK